MMIRDDSRLFAPQSVERDPQAVTIEVPERSRVARSPRAFGGATYDFLGAHGTTLYALSSTQTPGMPWPGFSTEDIDYANFPQGVNFEIIPLETPQGASMWGFTSQTFGGLGEMIVDSAKPTLLETTQRMHMHLNWVFTYPGTYKLRVRVIDASQATTTLRSARSAEQGVASSPFTVLTFNVAGEIEAPTQPSDQGSQGADQTQGNSAITAPVTTDEKPADGTGNAAQPADSTATGTPKDQTPQRAATPGQGNATEQKPVTLLDAKAAGLDKKSLVASSGSTQQKTSTTQGSGNTAGKTKGQSLAHTGATDIVTMTALLGVAGTALFALRRRRG